MKGNHPALLRALYIVLVPVVVLVILLNSGWLQRWFTAVRVHGESYTVVRYNFYYFDRYNAFLNENEDRLDELGYDPEQPDSKQVREDGLTWRDYFRQQADTLLAETAYYCDLAQAAGYVFTEDELAPVAQRLAEDDALRAQYNISADNYYVSYYGVGMDQERYTQELTRLVQAQAYKAHLISTWEPTQEEMDQWLADNPQGEGRAVRLRVITLDALPDRATGLVGKAHLDALRSKLDALVARYESGTSFEDLQSAFSTCALGDETGSITAVAGDLPEGLADWCLGDQSALAVGDTCAWVDEATGTAYFALLDGLDQPAAQLAARAALSVQAVETQAAQALAADYQVEQDTFGMLLANT